jgi:hypothetical protein
VPQLFKTWILRTLTLAAWWVAATTAAAHPQLVFDENGLLRGARAVEVGGDLYDVEWRTGPCSDVFGGCANAMFAFHSYDDAMAASQALLDQVFVDLSATQLYDSDPSRTVGCGAAGCLVLTPYFQDTHYLFTTYAIHAAAEASDGTGSATRWSLTEVLEQFPYSTVFAVWTESSVPVPGSLPLAALALFAAWTLRRQAMPPVGRCRRIA